jgi:hypothetical protein
VPVRLGAAAALLGALSIVALAAARTPPGPRVAGCPVFPATNAWNRVVSHAPVEPRSDAYIRSIDSHSNHFLHADFGGGGAYGIPYAVVPRSQPRVPIHFTDFGDESDPGPYPIPPGVPVERNSDRHVLVLQRGTCRLYELYGARRSGAGWDAGSGAVFNLRSNRRRPAGFTSADAAGLSIFAGLARYPEVRAGAIRHALRFTVRETQRAYVAPARHFASDSRDPDLPPMGLRLRLKASYSLARFHGESLIVLRALKRYGMIVADNGQDWYITGASDRRWNDEDLDQLKTVPGQAFEAVRSGALHRG